MIKHTLAIVSIFFTAMTSTTEQKQKLVYKDCVLSELKAAKTLYNYFLDEKNEQIRLADQGQLRTILGNYLLQFPLPPTVNQYYPLGVIQTKSFRSAGGPYEKVAVKYTVATLNQPACRHYKFAGTCTSLIITIPTATGYPSLPQSVLHN